MEPLELALTYDDVQLIPQYSEVNSRLDVDLTTELSRNYNLMIPLVASPMDTVCGYDMALAMMKMGGVGCIHRFMNLGERVSNVSRLHQIANPPQDEGSSQAELDKIMNEGVLNEKKYHLKMVNKDGEKFNSRQFDNKKEALDYYCELSKSKKFKKISFVTESVDPIKEEGSAREEPSDNREVRETWGNAKIPIMVACGVGEREFGIAASCIIAGANVILIDVAHGHHKKVKEMIGMLTRYRDNTGRQFDIIAGNIATAKAAKDLSDWGVDGIRVGIGGGALCSTRIETGHGVPNISAIREVLYEATVPIIADGGIRSAGDIAKAIAAGADTAMLGSLLAGTEEAPGDIIETANGLYKHYRGSASLETKSANRQETRNIEGVSTKIPFKGGVDYVIKRIIDGLQSACSYSGSGSLTVFKVKSRLRRVTPAGQVEAKPHLTI